MENADEYRRLNELLDALMATEIPDRTVSIELLHMRTTGKPVVKVKKTKI